MAKQFLQTEPVHSTRDRLSQWLGLLATLCLIAGFMALIYVWLVAWQQGKMPKPGWEQQALRGPWSQDEVLQRGLEWAVALPCCAAAIAAISCISKPNIQARIVLVVSLLFFCVVLLGHLGLVED